MIDKTKIIKQDNLYIYVDTDKTVRTKKKISGHSFVGLVDFDKFNKRGDIILSLLGIKKDEVDPKYAYRGELAEMVVRAIYERKLKKQIVWYDEEAKKDNNYDFFPTYLQCGGIPDIEIPSEQTLIEVKSKSMKDYAYIKEHGAPASELYQALYYGFLRKYKKITMFYVFFDEESEQLAFQNKPIKTYNNLKFLTQTYDVKEEEIDFLVKSALNYYNDCVKNKRIPISDLSKTVLNEIGVDYSNAL